MKMNDFIVHYGIKGQKYGVRRFQNEDGTLTPAGKERYYIKSDGTKDYKRLKRDAEKDAKKYARAQASYGEGAGNRRKKIKNLVSEKMKDPDYRSEFDKALVNQDMSKHQRAAIRERRAKKIIATTGSVAVTGLSLYLLAKQTGADKIIKAQLRQIIH